MSQGFIESLVAMKRQNPNLKTLAAVGGYNPEMIPLWYTLAENSESRIKFARNILHFLERTHLDGIGKRFQFLISCHVTLICV